MINRFLRVITLLLVLFFLTLVYYFFVFRFLFTFFMVVAGWVIMIFVVVAGCSGRGVCAIPGVPLPWFARSLSISFRYGNIA
jgi:hypothetical protein